MSIREDSLVPRVSAFTFDAPVPRVSAYTFDAPDGFEHETITVEATGKVVDDRYEPAADAWAIRRRAHGLCLNSDGMWELEPQPSERDDEFLARCRFPIGKALDLASEAARRLHSRKEAEA